jgi:uncharacterized delta-60 repeat protein
MAWNFLRRAALPLIAAGALLVACNGSTTTTAGPSTAFFTARLTTGGVLDASFGTGGFVVTDFDPNLFDFALAGAVQPADNKIVVGGSTGLAGQGTIALVRYNSGGSLDTAGFGTAGTGGLVRTATPPGWTSASVSVIAVQPADNKIVVAALVFNATSNMTGIALLRYMPNGALDTTFANSAGFVIATIGSGLAGDTCAMVLQGTNIIVAGASSNGSVVLYRYDTTGTLDTTFGTDPGGGKTTTSIGIQATSPGLAFQSAGAAIPGAIILVSGNGTDQVVLRYTAIGALDTTFGGVVGGIVATHTSTIPTGVGFANAVAVQSDDGIVVAGHANVDFTLDTSDVSLVRYNPNGTLDTTFGTSGIMLTDLGGFDNVFSMALTTPGAIPTSIVLSGNTGSAGISQGIALRYTSTGAPDPSFGPTATGIVGLPLFGPSNIASANAVVFQSTLGIVVAGYD